MKSRTRLAAGLITILLAGLITAQTKAVVTIGGSLWHAQWEISGDAFKGMKADASNWVGPYLNIRMGKVLLGTSMYFGTIPLKSSTEGSDFSLDLKRSDLNFSLGYSLLNNLNAFFAVKNVSIKGDQDIPYTNMVLTGYDQWGYPVYDYEILQTHMALENKGTLLGGGLSGTYRFQQSPFFLFGSFALLKGTLNSSISYTMDGQSVGTPYKNDNSITLTSFNAGVGILAGSGVSILLGFRGENSTGEGEGQEKVSGIMATLAYTLRCQGRGLVDPVDLYIKEGNTEPISGI